MERNPNAHVKKTAWRLAQENHASDPRLAQIRKPKGSKALELYEQARAAATPAQRKVVLDSFAAATDNWTRSALVAAATEQAPSYVAEALMHDRPQALTDFVVAVVPAALPDHARRLLIAAAGAGPAAVALKTSIVRAVARMEAGATALDLNAETTQALQKLLDDPATTAAALPIVAKWDKAGVLSAKADGHAQLMLRDLGDAAMSDERRADSAASLLAVPARRPQVLSAIAPMLSDPAVPASLKGRLIAALGETAGSDVDAVIIAALARTNSTPLFDQILKRPDSSLALLAAMKDGKVTPANLGPANVARLRTHPNRQVALQAAALLDALSPAAKAKSDIVAALLPEIEKPGDGALGKVLFTGACASCHKLGNLGKSQAGPPLDGMGAHGRAELLSHIVDPNREVDPSFWQWNVTTRKGETLAGVIASENAASHHASQCDRRRGDQEGRHCDAREYAPLAHARGARGAGRRSAARHPHVPGRRWERPEVPRRRSAPGLHGGQPPRVPPRRGTRRDGDAAQVRGRVRGRRAVLRDGPGEVRERRKPDRVEGWARPGESLG